MSTRYRQLDSGENHSMNRQSDVLNNDSENNDVQPPPNYYPQPYPPGYVQPPPSSHSQPPPNYYPQPYPPGYVQPPPNNYYAQQPPYSFPPNNDPGIGPQAFPIPQPFAYPPNGAYENDQYEPGANPYGLPLGYGPNPYEQADGRGPLPLPRAGVQTVLAQPRVDNADVDEPARPQALADEDDEPELSRARHGHIYDSFWTDNLPGGRFPEQSEVCFFRMGCSCCVGPCCNETRSKDWKRLLKTFTLWILIINLIMLIVEFVVGDFSMLAILLGPETDTLISLGAKYLPDVVCKYQVFRYITPTVLHGGVVHYLVNALFAMQVMLAREVYWGFLRMLALYIVGGVGACVASYAIYPLDVSVGASGALCAVFGGYIVDIARMWKRMPKQLRVGHVINVIVYLMVMVMWGFFVENIDNGAHLGGLLTGIFFGMIILQKKLMIRILGGSLLVIGWAIPSVLTYALVTRGYALCAYL